MIVIGCFTKHRAAGLLFVHGIDMGGGGGSGIGEGPVRRYSRFYRGRRARNAVRFSLEIRVTGCAALFSRNRIASRTMAARSIRFTPVRFNPPIDLSLPSSPTPLLTLPMLLCFCKLKFPPLLRETINRSVKYQPGFFHPYSVFLPLLFFFSLTLSLSFLAEWKCDGFS